MEHHHSLQFHSGYCNSWCTDKHSLGSSSYGKYGQPPRAAFMDGRHDCPHLQHRASMKASTANGCSVTELVMDWAAVLIYLELGLAYIMWCGESLAVALNCIFIFLFLTLKQIWNSSHLKLSSDKQLDQSYICQQSPTFYLFSSNGYLLLHQHDLFLLRACLGMLSTCAS